MACRPPAREAPRLQKLHGKLLQAGAQTAPCSSLSGCSSMHSLQVGHHLPTHLRGPIRKPVMQLNSMCPQPAPCEQSAVELQYASAHAWTRPDMLPVPTCI